MGKGRLGGVNWVLCAVIAMVITTLLCAPSAAQDEDPEPPPRPTPADSSLPDPDLPKISAALAGVTAPDLAALRSALHAVESLRGGVQGASPNVVTTLSGLDGDGTPEALLQWALPDVEAPDVAPAPDSRPAWGLYLLSWNGTKWQASRLLTDVEDFKFAVIHPGPPVGPAFAVVVSDDETYPVIFQVKAHVAALLWDGEADDSRFEPLLQSNITFLDHKGAPTVMLVTGRADPGLFHVDRNGQRGFTARAFYRWQGTAFVPEHTDYVPCPDYTIYRFISALHLHDYAAAYDLVAPNKFLKTSSPSLDKFRKYVQENLPEFLRDEIFTAPELPAGSPDDHLFLLDKPDKHLTYHPVFTHDGKFRLTGLTRAVESLPEGSEN